jgi:hypothetical protein
VNKDVQRLREPGAWVLLGSVALQILSGLISLFFRGGRLPFTFSAFQFITNDSFASGLTLTAIVVAAVLLATRLGGGPTPQARIVALTGLIMLGAVALLTVICVLAGLGAGNSDSGVLLDSAGSAKFAMFLYGIAKLAVLAVGGFYVLTVFQSFGPATPVAPQYPGQGFGQPGAQPPYGQPAYGPPPQQPVYGQQPYPQAGYGRPPYGQPAYAPPQQAPGVPPQQPPSAPPPQPPQPPAPQPPAPQPSPPQPAPPASGPPSGPQPAVQSEETEGEWTRAYGSGEISVKPEESKPEGSPGEPPLDPYRPPE